MLDDVRKVRKYYKEFVQCINVVHIESKLI